MTHNTTIILTPSLFSPSLTSLYSFLVLFPTVLLAYTFLFPSPPSSPSDPMALPTTPRKKTRMYWFTMFSLVGPVYLLAPFSGGVVGWRLAARFGVVSWPAKGGVGRIWADIGLGWAVLEVLFSFYHTYLHSTIQLPPPQTDPDPNLLRATFVKIISAGLSPSPSPFEVDLLENVLHSPSSSPHREHFPSSLSPQLDVLAKDDPRAISFRERFRTWFYHAPWEEIKRENVMSWIAWSCFGCSKEDAMERPVYLGVMKEALELIEARTGSKLPEGDNEDVKVMRLTLDKVHVRHRPLILYTLTAIINLAAEHLVYRRMGMDRVSVEGMDYLVYNPRSWTPEKGREESDAAPIVFIHGLGFGFLQNFFVILRILQKHPSHPLLVPVQPHISMDILHPSHLKPLDYQATVHSLASALARFGFTPTEQEGNTPRQGGAIVISHSNGSTTHAWLLKERPELIKRNCFVDPVCFCLWEGDVAFNFVYRHPTKAIELLMSYFIGSEIGIANTISRNFDWSANTLFFDDIPNGADSSRTAYWLGGKDAIINASHVREYLEHHGVSDGVRFIPHGSHGEALVNGKMLDQVLNWVTSGTFRE